MTLSTRSTNDFITDIYGTVIDTERWPDILDHVAWLAGAMGSNVCLMDYVAEEVNSQFMCTKTGEMAQSYANNPHMGAEIQALTMLPQVQHDTEFVSTTDYMQRVNAYSTDAQLDIDGMEDWLSREWSVESRYICRLNLRPSYFDLQCLLFGPKPAAQCQEGLAIVSQLMLHFAQAVEISRPFLLLKARFRATLDVLDRFQLGVFIVTDEAQVAMKNSAAERVLHLDDALTIDLKGRLKSRNVSGDPELQSVIDEILLQQRQGTFDQSTELVVKRRSGASPYIIEISPLSEPTVIGKVSGLMVIVIDPDHRQIVSTTGMQKLFDLTSAENHVCSLLVDGLSTQEIAEARNVSPVTVKNQINSLLAKTGNRSRSELIRQALNINLPVDSGVATG